jgi:membrane protein involved in colicin uptake
MNAITKRAASVGVSLAAVAAIVGGTAALASNVDTDAPRPASSVVEVEQTPAPFVAPISPEDEQIAEDAREAARIEAERLAAEKAAREKAERIAAKKAAEEEAARQAAESSVAPNTSPGVSTGDSAPAPEPAPAAPTKCPEGQVPGMVDDAGNESMCYEGDYTGGVVVP